jgi:hypothetical protein
MTKLQTMRFARVLAVQARMNDYAYLSVFPARW